MKKVFLLAIAAAFTFTACKDNKAEATTTDASATEMNTDHEGHNHEDHDHGTEPEASTTTAVTAKPSTTSTPSADAKGVKLNPAHGEPGHRCEIPVGAPLDGSATPVQQQAQAAPSQGGFLGSGNAQAQQGQANQVQTKQQAAPAQQTAPGMQGKPNPAHGQPGHRCDVQVGQPLP